MHLLSLLFILIVTTLQVRNQERLKIINPLRQHTFKITFKLNNIFRVGHNSIKKVYRVVNVFSAYFIIMPYFLTQCTIGY